MSFFIVIAFLAALVVVPYILVLLYKTIIVFAWLVHRSYSWHKWARQVGMMTERVDTKDPRHYWAFTKSFFKMMPELCSDTVVYKKTIEVNGKYFEAQWNSANNWSIKAV